jgi:hypothetical protein
VKSVSPMSGQSRSGGGGGMQKSGYDGWQLRVGALVVVVTRRRVVVVAGLGRRVVVVALTVVVGSGSVVVVVVVLAGTMEVMIEVTVTVRGSGSAAAPPAAAPTKKPMTPQMRPAAQGRRHQGRWLGWRGGRGGGGAPQPVGGPCAGGGSQPPPGGIGSVGRSPMACPLSLLLERGDSTMSTRSSRFPIWADMPRPVNAFRARTSQVSIGMTGHLTAGLPEICQRRCLGLPHVPGCCLTEQAGRPAGTRWHRR